MGFINIDECDIRSSVIVNSYVIDDLNKTKLMLGDIVSYVGKLQYPLHRTDRYAIAYYTLEHMEDYIIEF